MMRLLLCFICLGASTQAVASAPWTQQDGEIYTRASLHWGTLEDVRLWRADLYAEYGIAETWTLSLKGEVIRLPDADISPDPAWRVTIRKRLLQAAGFVTSAEAGLTARADIGASAGCDTTKLELRSGGAWSGVLATRPLYLFAEGAVRLHDRCPTQHFDFGVGYRVHDKISLVNQIWLERGERSTDVTSFQTELLWHGDEFDLSVGYQNELGGAFDETALVVAAVRRF